MASVAAVMKSSCHGRGTLAAHRYSLMLLLLPLLVMLQAHVGEASREDITRQQVFVGESITLKCYAKPDHLRSYRWVYIRQGTKRPQVLSSGRTLIVQEPRFSLNTRMEGSQVNLELKLTDVHSHESGLFMCWRQGQKPDPQVLVTILEHGSQSEQQAIVHSESPTVVQYGEAATFSCYIQPAWPIRVTWLKDGKMISWRDRLYTQTKKRLLGNTQEQDTQDDQLVASLFVASVRQNASFTCRIETSPPEEHSMQITVRVPRVDSLTAEPDKDLVEYGQPLTLTCTISGSNSEVVWLKDGSELVFGPAFPKRRKQSVMHPPNKLVSTVHFESVSFADNGQYVCYIPGASRNILINIEGRPPRLLGVTGNNFYEDEELSLRCTTQYARNAGTQVTVTWTFEGAVINPNAYQSLTYPGEHNMTIHQLVLTRASARNIGTYQCITPFGSAQIYVEMYAPPSLSEPLPSEVHFQEGEFFQLPCLTIGHPLPSVHWEKKAGDMWEVVEGSEGSGSSSELIFLRSSASDAGTYRCVAKSEAGSFLAEVFAIMERPDPEVLEIIAPETVVVGENFTIQCTVRNWEAEVEFTLNGESLMSSLAERFNVLRYPMEESLTEAFLIVRDSELEDSGQYRCSAGGAVSLPAPVLIKLPEARVVGLSASAPVVGRDLNITCVVNNWDGLVTFVFNNEAVEPQLNGWRYAIFPGVEGDTVSTHILTVPSATHHHSGRYECFTTPSSSRALNINIWDIPEVTLELQNMEERNWRDAPTPIACKIKGISPDMVTVLFSHEDTPQVSIQNRTKMSTSSQLVNVAVSEEEGDEPLTIFTLGFYSLSKDFEGLWSCEVFLPSGDYLNKDSLYLEIYEPPEFVNPPPEQLFQEDGTDLRLDCSASGPSETMVAWYRQGIQEPIVFDRMSAQLFIPRFTTTDEGYYVCRASSHGRQIQTNTYLSLGTPQPRVESVVASPAVVGQEFSVNCIVSNWDREVVFFHNKESLDFRPNSRYSKEQHVVLEGEVEQQHLVTHTLRVADAVPADSGVVECFLTTEIFGSINVTVTDMPATNVTVHASETTLPPGQIVQLSGPQSVPAGSELVLTCVVSPQVPQDIDIVMTRDAGYLYIGGVVLAEDPRVDVVADSAYDGSRILYLRIVDVKVEDKGNYQCAAYTNPPTYSSLDVSVAVGEKPTELPEVVTMLPPIPDVPYLAVTPMLLPGVMDILGQEGENVTMPCRISPIIDFSMSENIRNYFAKWTRGGSGVTEIISQDNIIMHYDEHRMNLNTEVDTRTSGVMHYDLTLKQVVPEDSGVYACTLFDKSLNQVGHREISLDVEMPQEEWKCEFPPEWRGEWYDTRYRQVSEILPQEFKRSTCVSTSGENFVIKHKRRQCFRCVHFIQKHQNLLQYKSTRCRRTQEGLCSILDENSELMNLVRLNTEDVHCPFTGPRQYSLELPRQPCEDNASLITSSTESHLQFQYPSCWVLANPSRPVAEEFRCVADWAEGSTHYLIARLLNNSSLYLEQLYRCFTYTQGKDGRHAYIMGHNDSPVCGNRKYLMTLKISELIGEAPLSVTGLGEWNISVESSEGAVLPCRASVLLGSDEASSRYVISWRREIEGKSEVITANGHMLTRSSRYSLDMGPLRPSNTSKYDLIIADVQPGDAGTYSCMLRNRKGGGQGVSHSVSLTVTETPKYEQCILPVHWSGEWWSKEEGVIPIGDGIFGASVCDIALGDNFLMRGPTCNTCYSVKEMHFNLLYYKKSPCERIEDMNTLCSMIEEHEPRQSLIRKEAGITCPFPGSRSYVYQTPEETCAETHSKLISNNTQLYFLHQPCHPHSGAVPDLTPNLVQCVAIWSEGSTHYLMGKVDEGEGYRCFTFEEAMNQPHLFIMGQAQTEVCEDLGDAESRPLYRIFGKSKAPELPIVEGDEASRQVLLGDAITMTCSSRGGVPPPILKWFRVVDGSREELPSQAQDHGGITKAAVDIVVDASDKYAEYYCEASNFATTTPLRTNTSLTFTKDYASIMVPQVLVVEYQPAFLPCARTLEDDVQMEWFDAELELKLTSGSTLVNQDARDPKFVPYMQEGVMGLMVVSSFLDTTFGCFIDGVELGNTSLIIFPKYLVLEESQVSDPLKYFMPTTAKMQPPLGDTATLNCSLADGVNSTLVSWWRYPGNTLLTQGSVNLAREDGYSLDVSDNSYQLTVSNATLKHSGLYICQVALNEVELYRRNFSINVEGLITTQLGGTVAISCYSPVGEVTFIYNGEAITGPHESLTDKYRIERDETSGDGAVYTLSVTDVAEEDLGVYTCIRAGHPDHVLQETTVSSLGEEVTTMMTTAETTELPTTEMTTTETTTAATTTTTTTTPPSDYDYDYQDSYLDSDLTNITTSATTTMTIPTTEATTSMTEMPTSTSEPVTTTPPPTTTPFITTTQPATTTTIPTTTTESYTTTEEITMPTTTIDVTTDTTTEEIPVTTSTIPTTTTTTTTPTTTTTTTTPTTTTTTTTEAPTYKEELLSCKGHDPEFINWKYNGKLIFLGTIDMAGIPGTKVTIDGDLVLTAGPFMNLRDDDTYICYLELDASVETPVVIYNITLDGDDTVVEETLVGTTNGIPLPEPEPEPEVEPEPEPLPDLQFSGLKEEEIAILANSKRIGYKMEEVLGNGGLNVRLLEDLQCEYPNNTLGWARAKSVLEECETEARWSGELGPTQSVFIGIDFFVQTFPGSWFALTQLYLNNVKHNVTVEVFTQLVPVPDTDIIKSPYRGEPDSIQVSEEWWNNVQGVDKPFGSALLSSILSLQKSYLRLLEKTDDS